MDSQLWHEQCLAEPPVEPPHLSSKQWRAMSDETRQAHIKQLDAWLGHLYLPTAAFTQIERVLDETLRDNSVSRRGAKQIVILTGPNVIGKSTFMLRWATTRYIEWTQAAAQDGRGRPIIQPAEGVEADLCPVVWIDLPAAAKVNDINVEILAFFNLPDEGRTRTLTHRAMRALHRHRAQVVIVDDAHLLKTDCKSGRDVLDHVKSVNTKLGQVSGATLILVGADLEDGDLVNDPQIAGRSEQVSVGPYGADTVPEQTEWQRVVRDLEQLILPHLPAGKPGMLYLNLAGELWFRTQGYLGDLMKMIRKATLAASADDTHRITARHLNAITLSKRAETGRVNEAAHRRSASANIVRRQGRRTDTGTLDISEAGPEVPTGAKNPGLPAAVGHERPDSPP
jgi:TniB protein